MVKEGVTLTIEPGVTIKINTEKALQIDGELIAQGTEAEPIGFISNQTTPTAGDWGYILFTNTSVDAEYDGIGNYLSGSIMQYCTIEFAGWSDNPALRIESASPFIDHCTIRNNANRGISSSDSSMLKISNCTISHNAGNGIYTSDSVMIVKGNTITHNTASDEGGGIHASGTATPSIIGNTITNNLASGSGYICGGGIYVKSETYTISDNTIANNTATCTACGGWGCLDKDGWGGGIYAYTTWTSTVTISGNTITNNTASSIGRGWGGGIYLGGNVCVMDNIIINNVASTSGGGICYHVSYGSHTNTSISDNNISGNSAPSGGGIYCSAGQSANITRNTITNNFVSQGDGKAGGIYIYHQPTINYNNIYDNTPYDIYNSNQQGTPDINLINNWWGTTEGDTTMAQIYDWSDNASLGIVDSIPYLTEPITPESNPPTANAGGPYSGNVNGDIQFKGSGTDPDGDAITAYAWDFNNDDITDSTLQNPTHLWSSAGTYYPALKVQDERGAWSPPNECTVLITTPRSYDGSITSVHPQPRYMTGKTVSIGADIKNTGGNAETYDLHLVVYDKHDTPD